VNEGHFRKWGKYYLAIMSIFLMVAFAMPTINQQASGGGNAEIGRLNGKKVPANELRLAAYEVDLLRRLTMADARMKLPPDIAGYFLTNNIDEVGSAMDSPLRWQSVGFRLRVLLTMLNDREPELHFYLLQQEAIKQGMYATEQEISNFLAASPFTRDAESLHKFMEERQITEDRLRRVVGHGLSVIKLIDLANEAIQPSLPQIEHLAVESRSQVRIDYAVLDAALHYHKMPEPTDAQLKAHFDKYKSILARDARANPPVIDGRKLPFGYKWPDRVRVEYLKFNFAAIRAKLTATPDDAVNALKVYNENPARFKTETPSTMPTAGLAPASRVKTFEEVKKQLIDEQVSLRAEKILSEMIRRLQIILSEPWRAQRIDEKGFRNPLPRDQWVSYSDPVKGAAIQLQKQRDSLGYLPDVVAPAGLLAPEELAALPDIGGAVYVTQTEQAPFPALAINVRELGVEKGVLGQFLQVGMEGPVLRDRAGNAYVYRIVEASKSHEPKDVSEVADAVRVDLRKLAAFEALKADGEKLKASAVAGDFAAAARKLDTRVQETDAFARLQRDETGSPRPTKLVGLENVSQFVEESFELAEAASSSTQPGKTARPATTFANDQSLQVFVLQLKDYRPLPRDEFEKVRTAIVADATILPRMRFAPRFMEMKRVADRINFTPRNPWTTTE